MTKEEALHRIKSLFPDLNAYLENRCRELINSNAVDLEDPRGDFGVPKLVLTAALQDAAEQCYSPASWDKAGRKIIKNLRHF